MDFFGSDIVVILKIVCNFAYGKVSLFKRFGRLLNKEASEPGGAEAIVFLGGRRCLGRLIYQNRKAI